MKPNHEKQLVLEALEPRRLLSGFWSGVDVDGDDIYIELRGPGEFIVYTVEADPALQALLIDRERKFWDMVQQGVPPEPVTYKDVVARFGLKSEAAGVHADEATLEAVSKLQELRGLKKEMDALGIECIHRMDTDYENPQAQFKDIFEFVKKQFGMTDE